LNRVEVKVKGLAGDIEVGKQVLFSFQHFNT